jgi:hypothetical protein
MRKAMDFMNESGGTPVRPRTHAEITRFFRSLDLVEPGVVTLPMWRPDPIEVGSLTEVSEFCGVGRKV